MLLVLIYGRFGLMFFKRLRAKRQKRRLKKMLEELDMTLEEVLEESPYAYGYWQGEGYRIWDKQTKNKYLAQNLSKLAAELWIVGSYFAAKEP